jgi:hypothetical protein
MSVVGAGSAFRWMSSYSAPWEAPDGARIVAICLMVTGVCFVAVLTAAAAERFVRSRREEERGIEERLDHIIARLDQIERRAGGRGSAASP